APRAPAATPTRSCAGGPPARCALRGAGWPATLSSSSLQRPGNLETREALDLIADTDILVVLHPDAALRSGAHLVDIVLEAAQGFESALEDDDVVAQHADRIVPPDITFYH